MNCKAVVLLTTAFLATLSGSATAAFHTANLMFDPPAGGPPTLGGTPTSGDAARAQEYDRTVGVSYDDATGSVVLTLAEFAPDYWGNALPQHKVYLSAECGGLTDDANYPTPGTLFMDMGSIDGEGTYNGGQANGPSSHDPHGQNQTTATATLGGAHGALGATGSFDGQKFTFTFSDPLLRNRSWRCLTVAYGNGPQTASLSGWPILMHPIYGQAQVAPRSVLLDHHDSVTGVRWNGWGGPTATGSGLAHFNLCTPCSAGHFTNRRVTLLASSVRTCDGVRQYTYLRFRFRGAPIFKNLGRSGYGYLVCGSVLWLGNQRQ